MNVTNLEKIGKENGVKVMIMSKYPNLLGLRIIDGEFETDFNMKAIDINEDNILRKIAEFKSGR